MSTQIDEYSLSTVPIEQVFNETSLGMATSFVWEKGQARYLITNWHVVTCRNNETGVNLRKDGGRPNKLKALFRPQPNFIDTVALEIPIRDSDDNPLWLHHPVHRREVDIVAIPLSGNIGGGVPVPINLLARQNLSVQIGMDVFILGYPFGAPPPSLPVWKRGSLASEPKLAQLGEKFYLVDTASRPGMSGAPVIMRTYGAHLTESGTSLTNAPATKFLGIYSGRLHTADAEDAQLGRVWPRTYIEEIIDANTKDDDQ